MTGRKVLKLSYNNTCSRKRRMGAAMKFIKKYPFLTILSFSAALLSVIGFAGKNNLYSDYKIVMAKTPQLAAVFEGMGEGKYPWMIDLKHTILQNKALRDPGAYASTSGMSSDASRYISKDSDDSTSAVGSNKIINSVSDGKEGAKPTPEAAKKTTKSSTAGKSGKTSSNKGKQYSKNSGDNNTAGSDNVKNSDRSLVSNQNSNKNSEKTMDRTIAKDASADLSDPDPEKENETAKAAGSEYKFKTVTEKYFNDALFIGDSRTVGLSEYSGWSKPTYFADVGLTIYDIFDRKIADMDGKKVTIPEALKNTRFGKIYIMVGINELGRGTTKTFIEEYKKVLAKIKDLQPNAIIFIEGIMEVAKEKSDTDPIFNNTNISEKNRNLAKLADNRDLFYIDVNEAVTDKSGNLPSDYTFDNIHLKAAYYKLWTGFLLKHGVVKN